MNQGKDSATTASKAAISAAMIKELREKSGAGMMECRKALEESRGSLEKAILILREKGVLAAEKKKDRIASEGRIEAYVHFGGKIGTLVEVNCETDFVAKTEEFQALCKNLAMQVAASTPKWISRQAVPQEILEEERSFFKESAEKDGKTGEILEKIAEGKMEKFFQIHCLLEQPFIKNPDRSVGAIIKEVIAKVGENIVVKRMVRFALGETKA